MSVTSFAKAEIERANFEPDDKKALLKILDIFFNRWDSGGAVWAMAPVLQRLIACKPLSPLTGEADEWTEVGEQNGGPLYQSKRCATVFKDVQGAYDIDTDSRVPITFPYMPKEAKVMDPVVEL